MIGQPAPDLVAGSVARGLHRSPVPLQAVAMVSPGRVLHVAQPTEQGVAVVVADYVRLLVDTGWKVTVACPVGGDLAGESRANGAEVRSWRATRSPGSTVPSEAARLARIIADIRPDVVHLHSSKAGMVGRLAIRGRVPTLFSPHAWSFLHGSAPMRRAALTWERFGRRWTDVLVCGSEDELATGRRSGITGEAVVIPNAVRVDASIAPDREEARATVAPIMPPDAPLAVCVGRLAAQKGQDVLLRAWPAVRANVPTAQLVLVGDGPTRDELAEMATSGVTLAGAASRDRVLTWIRAADLVVAPSRWETMSLAVLEALALGRPVVATDVQGMRSALDGGAGRLVPRDDVDALAEAVISYMVDRRRCAEDGMAAAGNYSRRWSSQMVANGALLNETYGRLMGSRRDRRPEGR